MKVSLNIVQLQKQGKNFNTNNYNKCISFGNDNIMTDSDTFSKDISVPIYEKGSYEWALHWDEDTRKQELEKDLEKAKKAMSWWKRTFTSAPYDLEIANKAMLENERLMVNTLLKNSVMFQKSLDSINAEKVQNAKELAEIEEGKKQFVKLEQASKIASAFKTNNKGGLDDCIA